MNNTPQKVASVPYTCKICGQPGVARYSLDCDQDWLDRLHPMLAHNHCSDRHLNFTKAGDRLVAACLEIDRRSLGFERLVKDLRNLTERYAKAFAARHNSPVLFHEDFVDMLREQPGQVGRILAQYRKQAMTLVVESPQPSNG